MDKINHITTILASTLMLDELVQANAYYRKLLSWSGQEYVQHGEYNIPVFDRHYCSNADDEGWVRNYLTDIVGQLSFGAGVSGAVPRYGWTRKQAKHLDDLRSSRNIDGPTAAGTKTLNRMKYTDDVVDPNETEDEEDLVAFFGITEVTSDWFELPVDDSEWESVSDVEKLVHDTGGFATKSWSEMMRSPL